MSSSLELNRAMPDTPTPSYGSGSAEGGGEVSTGARSKPALSVDVNCDGSKDTLRPKSPLSPRQRALMKQRKREQKHLELLASWRKQMALEYKIREGRVAQRSARLREQRANHLTPSELAELVMRNGLDPVIAATSPREKQLPSKADILNHSPVPPKSKSHSPSHSPRLQAAAPSSTESKPQKGAASPRPLRLDTSSSSLNKTKGNKVQPKAHSTRPRPPPVRMDEVARPGTSPALIAAAESSQPQRETFWINPVYRNVSPRLYQQSKKFLFESGRYKHLHPQPIAKPVRVVPQPAKWTSKGCSFNGSPRTFSVPDIPGPGAYDTRSLIGTASAWTMKGRTFASIEDMSKKPDPGAYDPYKPLGQDALKISIGLPAKPADAGSVPGPGSYEVFENTGTISHVRPNVPSHTIATKVPMVYGNDNPGPGQGYDPDSFVDKLHAAKSIGMPLKDLAAAAQTYKPGPGSYTVHKTHDIGGRSCGPHFSMLATLTSLAPDNHANPGPGTYVVPSDLGDPRCMMEGRPATHPKASVKA